MDLSQKKEKYNSVFKIM